VSDCSDGRGASQRRPTSLSIREARAQFVYEAIADDLVHALTFEDIATLPAIRNWRDDIRDQAVADLVEDGRLYDDAIGRLLIRPWRAAA